MRPAQEVSRRVGAGALALCLALAGCGDDNSSGGSNNLADDALVDGDATVGDGAVPGDAGDCLPDANGVLGCDASCVARGEVCTADMDCCDGICLGGVCEPNYADCEPIGGSCTVATDCCSDHCDTTAGICLPIVN